MVYVMSDIHGNLPFFRSVMRQIRLRKNDTLYILGDVIDRHPDGIKILKYIMKKANIRMLLGNHEYMMLNTLCKQTANGTNYYRAKRLWMKNGGKVTLDAFNRCHAETQEAILSFLKSLPLSFDIQVNDNIISSSTVHPKSFLRQAVDGIMTVSKNSVSGTDSKERKKNQKVWITRSFSVIRRHVNIKAKIRRRYGQVLTAK